MREILSSSLQALRARALSDGGFADLPVGEYRPDATAWAILVLAAADHASDLIELARSRLVRDQLKDGRISISPYHPGAFWPTAPTILAWQGSPPHRDDQSRAIQFLLRVRGHHWTKSPDDPAGHDTSIEGWPWIADTHSWVEPTALSIIALQVTGYSEHERVQEATQMLLNRQLPQGGWNYGNTTVFGRELRPSPESTGAALNGLAGRVPRKLVVQSLDYLRIQVQLVRTPIALGWGLLGLSAWGELPNEAPTMIRETLGRQKRYGAYETSMLCLALAPLLAPRGLASIVGI